MGKHKKSTGKGRLDKFYHLAKDTGYRARSAFKLIQLAKKYDFLSSANVCLDLCAAPGGWSQVAVKYMPRDSQVVAVDLVPIKGLKGVTSIVSDITTQKCRQLLQKEFRGGMCDVVLNDGAPNVGANWAKDAYTQSELVLHAGKLACEFLRAGGTFVTKVFRSADYNSLLWVFGQLFGKVEATKPQASRNVSAEIFVVCSEFKAPSKLDPRFFDPKWVFMETTKEVTAGGPGNTHLASLVKSQGKKNRSGYAEGDDYRTMSAADFIAATNPAELLMKHHKILFPKDCDEIAEHALTTPTVRAFCEDLKVLGKGELAQLIKWRFKFLRLRASAAKSAAPTATKVVKETEEEVDDRKLNEMMDRATTKERAAQKRLKERLKKQQLRVKQSLGATVDQNDPDLYIGGKSGFSALEAAGGLDEYLSSEESEDDVYREEIGSEDERLEFMEAEQNLQYSSEKQKALLDKTMASQREQKAKKETRREQMTRQWTEELREFDQEIDKRAQAELDAEDAGSDSDADMDSDSEDEAPVQGKAEVRADRFFSSGVFKDLDVGGMIDRPKPKPRVAESSSEASEGEEVEGELGEEDLPFIPMTDKQKRKVARAKLAVRKEKKKEKARAAKGDDASDEEPEQWTIKGTGKTFELAPKEPDLAEYKPNDKDELAETLAIGSLLTRKKSRMEMVDSAFHRYAFDDDEDLPDWFVEEESANRQRELPVSKEVMRDFRAKLREINARPIRKVAEAQGRKRKRAVIKLERLRKQASSLANNDDISNKSKVRELKRAMSKVQEDSKKKIQVVASKKAGGAVKGSKGKKVKGGTTKVVDKRLKSDKRGMKTAAKKIKKKTGKAPQAGSANKKAARKKAGGGKSGGGGGKKSGGGKSGGKKGKSR